MVSCPVMNGPGTDPGSRGPHQRSKVWWICPMPGPRNRDQVRRGGLKKGPGAEQKTGYLSEKDHTLCSLFPLRGDRRDEADLQ